MRFAGIDVGSEHHSLAVIAEDGAVLLRPRRFAEDEQGHAKARQWLGEPDRLLVVLEATGAYWKNLFAMLLSDGYQVAVLNPLRSRRFAEEDLQRAKTDSVDALLLARLAAQKRPQPTPLPDALTDRLRELVRLRDRFVEDHADRSRQLHHLVSLTFPEFKRQVRQPSCQLGTAILGAYPTGLALARASIRRLASLRYDGQHRVGERRSRAIVEAARHTVGQHHADEYRIQVQHACEDLETLRRRITHLDTQIREAIDQHEVGRLLTTINGIGPTTSARLVAEFGDLSRFHSGAALAAHVGVVPATKHSGKHRPQRAGLSRIGSARLRRSLYMPTVVAVRFNPWLRAYYEGLIARGKLPKVALMAAMRKLLTLIYSVSKNRRPFTPHTPLDQPTP